MRKFGYKQSNSDHTLFLKCRMGKLTALIIYVNDMIVTGDDPIDTPIEQNHKLFYNLGTSCAEKERYQRLVGELIYLSHTWPDIAYAVSVVSQFMHDPRVLDMDAVDHILRYLKSSLDKGLLFSKHGHLNVEGYTNADGVGSADNRRSTSGYFTFVRGNLVTWRSKKQSVVSRSSVEAEYRGMANGVCELLWL
ncbi:secreted RxLR effector protein 161-like [Tripterygium wilfordii]|uniref:secreted RxLR effector protein 161-like n=1 Tax=Tripterygium wilfordii TaxID=458696 RepID=UPI0018F821EF|nr:secreted RxLR effector protein 161-like [Tripterygium wilfordii]